jgi:hypothetical protein
MKILVIFALVAAVYSAPTDISDNNIGDIVNVGVNADLTVSNQIDFTSLSLEVIRRNWQAILLALGGRDGPQSRFIFYDNN